MSGRWVALGVLAMACLALWVDSAPAAARDLSLAWFGFGEYAAGSTEHQVVGVLLVGAVVYCVVKAFHVER